MDIQQGAKDATVFTRNVPQNHIFTENWVETNQNCDHTLRLAF